MKTESEFFRLRVHLAGVLMAGGVFLCSATVLGFLGRYSWFLDLCTHFRVQYLLGLLLAAAILLLQKKRRAPLVFLLLAAVNAATVAPLYFGGQGKADAGTRVLRAMQLNVNTRGGDPLRVEQAITDAAPDIVALEEISSGWVVDLAPITNHYPHVIASPREDNFGLALYSKFPILEREVIALGTAGVPAILATLDTGGERLRVAVIHTLPPAGEAYTRIRNLQLEELAGLARSPHPQIVLGDFNTTPWSYHFKKLLRESGLLDSTRSHGVQPTWHRENPLLAIPIDHCLHSPEIVILGRHVGPAVGSDHRPLIVEFSISGRPADPARWRQD